MKFEKYRKIYSLGHEETKDIFKDKDDEIIIEEKIDGGNFRFYINKKGALIIGSRTQQLTDEEGNYTNVHKMFLRCADYVKKAINKFINDFSMSVLIDSFSSCIFYGENCMRHTMGYDWGKIPLFLGFDIRRNDMYLSYDVKKKYFSLLNLEVVPLIKKVKVCEIIDSALDDNIVPISKYASQSSKDQKAEGIVFKNYNKQIFAKYVRDKFKEANAEAFGGNPKYNKVDNTDNAKIVFKFCTNARIDKIIFKLIDEGFKLELKLMEYLPKRVYKDIMEEEWRELVFSRLIIDFGKLNKLITKRCLSVLKQVMVNNALEDNKKR